MVDRWPQCSFIRLRSLYISFEQRFIHWLTMTLDITHSLPIIELMENYLAKVRPEPEIRPELDLGYEITGQSVMLHEIRPVYGLDGQIQTSGYAKATYVKKLDHWKVFWRRADRKWHAYPPQPTVKTLADFLALVDENKHGCF